MKRLGEGSPCLSFRRGKGAAWVLEGVWKEEQGGPKPRGRQASRPFPEQVCVCVSEAHPGQQAWWW
jgi:hypothetical protein